MTALLTSMLQKTRLSDKLDCKIFKSDCKNLFKFKKFKIEMSKNLMYIKAIKEFIFLIFGTKKVFNYI